MFFVLIGEARDVYWYAQTLFLTGQYHRALHLIKNDKLEKVEYVKCMAMIRTLFNGLCKFCYVFEAF